LSSPLDLLLIFICPGASLFVACGYTRLEAERSRAEEERDEAVRELAQLQAKIEAKRIEVQHAVDGVSNTVRERIEVHQRITAKSQG